MSSFGTFGTIALLGGTGPEGKGLASRLAASGERVVLGSRSAERAQTAAEEANSHLAEISMATEVTGDSNEAAAQAAEVVFLCVPFSGQAAVLSSCRSAMTGKIAVSVVSPIAFVNGKPGLQVPDAGSAAEDAAKILPEARWVAGFHTLPARDLSRVARPMETDTFICSDDDEAKRAVMDLAGKFDGLRAVDAGPLTSARYLEGATALLLVINRIHRAHASLRVAGLGKS